MQRRQISVMYISVCQLIVVRILYCMLPLLNSVPMYFFRHLITRTVIERAKAYSHRIGRHSFRHNFFTRFKRPQSSRNMRTQGAPSSLNAFMNLSRLECIAKRKLLMQKKLRIDIKRHKTGLTFIVQTSFVHNTRVSCRISRDWMDHSVERSSRLFVKAARYQNRRSLYYIYMQI